MEKKRLYRNIVDIRSDQGMDIDEGSLWEKTRNGKMVLVDEDQYITVDYDFEVFRRQG